MRTRRSWRNQNRLWKELGKEGAKKEEPKPVIPPKTDEEIDAMFWIPKTSRALMKKDAAKKRAGLKGAAMSLNWSGIAIALVLGFFLARK